MTTVAHTPTRNRVHPTAAVIGAAIVAVMVATVLLITRLVDGGAAPAVETRTSTQQLPVHIQELETQLRDGAGSVPTHIEDLSRLLAG